MRPLNPDGYRLLHEGAIALAHIEQNGIKIDEEYVNRTIDKASKRMARSEAILKEDPIFKVWRRKAGGKFKITAKEQLATVLADMGISKARYHPPTAAMQKKGIKRGNIQTDKEVFKEIDHPFVREWQKLISARDTRSRIIALKRETINGFFHPNFNLHLASTFRSSSGKDREDERVDREFNFQNIPVRDDEKAKLIRTAFVPRGPKYRIGELDQKILEVRVGCCYHEDRNMIRYIVDESTDMHRNASMDCWMLEEEQVSDKIRSCTKNAFVFAQFYGDWYKHCAQYLWKWMTDLELKREDGCPLIKHLERKGITELGKCDPDRDPIKGTFEYHIKTAEQRLWKRFAGYAQWKKDWFGQFLDRGYFDTLTGFRVEGVYNRKEVCNYPIQGSAFHCLLWAIIRIQKWLEKKNMRTRLCGQIHDSIIPDIYEPEMDDFLEKAIRVMTEDIRKEWDWLIVPLKVDVQVAPLGMSWYAKEKL